MGAVFLPFEIICIKVLVGYPRLQRVMEKILIHEHSEGVVELVWKLKLVISDILIVAVIFFNVVV